MAMHLKSGGIGRQASLILTVAIAWPSIVDTDTTKEITVRVAKDGSLARADAAFTAPVTPRQAWEVMTDYDRMAEFLPNLHSSKVIERSGNKLLVSQSGTAPVGPFSMRFDSVREVELQPYVELRSRAVSGTVKKGIATTRLIDKECCTLIVYHSELVPDIWIPLGISAAFIETAIRRQLESLRAEMIRRKEPGG